MKILGIETSCDETAAAVVEEGRKLLSNTVASSTDLHAAYGGVVPEIAARSHVEVMVPVIDEALKTAELEWSEIDAIAVTQGPGLLGSLLIGTLAASTLSAVKNVPLYGINHVEAHVYASFMAESRLPGYDFPPALPRFPLLALIVSGGHSQIALFHDHGSYRLLGQTGDDAVGEAFDKVAKMLGLPYPGGPSISKAAENGDETAVKLPIAKLASPYDFSFSGLKTAVLRAAQAAVGKDFTLPSSALPKLLNAQQKADLAASFQATAVRALITALKRAKEEFEPKNIVIAGGVAANGKLREEAAKVDNDIIFPDIKLCTDNAAMIATLGYFKMKSGGQKSDPYSLQPDPGLAM